MKKILVIDDDDQVRLQMKMILEEEGYAVMEANDGNKGIIAFSNEKFDLVITDLVMPEKDGLATIISIKQMAPGVKIFAISGDEGDRSHLYLRPARMLGAHLTFTKPLNWELLIRKIDETIN